MCANMTGRFKGLLFMAVMTVGDVWWSDTRLASVGRAAGAPDAIENLAGAGLVMRLWCAATAGTWKGAGLAEVDELLGVDGMGQAMVAAGVCEVTGEGLVMLVEMRSATAIRQARARAKKRGAPVVRPVVAKVVPVPTPTPPPDTSPASVADVLLLEPEAEAESITPDSAERVLAHLCAVTGRPFRRISPEMRARIKEEGAAECIRVIDVMASHWLKNSKMREHLDTVCLFRVRNFSRYQSKEMALINGGNPHLQPGTYKEPKVIDMGGV